MKRAMALISMLFAVGIVLASTASSGASTTEKNHKMTVEVVSVDAAAKTLTVKDDKGENHTAPVMGKAVDSLKSLKPGEKIVVTCHDDAKGAHEGITHIRVAGATHTSTGRS